MVRTRAFDPAEALNRAMELFSTRGYSETSMDDLVKATGVSRYGLYGTFGNKRELFEQALERYADRMGRKSFLRLLEPDASLADIRRIFEERIQILESSGRARGCMLSQTAMELAPHDSEIKDVLQRFIKRIAKTFAVGLDAAKEKGQVRASLDTRAAADFLTGALFGLAVLASSGLPRETLDHFVDNTISSLS
jgi:TetR/AcrR family transcriptional regulator, transcriptional repressor for nem operon